MKSQHRSLVAIILSIAVIIVWYAFFNPNKPVPGQHAHKAPAEQAEPAAPVAPATEAKQAEPVVREAAAVEVDATDPQAGEAEVETIIDNGRVRAVFTNKGGVLKSWELKKYHQTTDTKGPLIDLVDSEPGLTPALALSFNDANFAFPKLPTYRLISATDTTVVYEWRSDEAVVTKAIAVDAEQYKTDITVQVKNLTRKTLTATPTLSVGASSLPVKKKGFFGFLKPPSSTNSTPIYYLDGKVYREKKIAKLPAAQVFASDPQKGGGLYWAGLESRYFLNTVIPRELSSDVKAVVGAKPLPSLGAGAWALTAGASLAPANILAGGTSEMKFSSYMGPKEINELKAVGVNLDKAIDYGWFTIIAMPILYLLKLFYSVVRNYGVAIILLTILIKLLLHPINLKSMKSMKAMQQLQPKLKELQAKYKDNKEKLNTETMQLFRSHKVNPMGGCLPMVLQFPIYIALYKVLWNSIELYHAPFFWFYKDLSAPDPYLITPILLGFFMIFQQKMMPSATGDPAQKKMMMIMPVMFTVFMVFLPVGLVVYILVNTVMTVVTQWMYNKGIRMRDVLRFKFKPARQT